MSFEPITRWVLRCDGDTTRGQCPERLHWTDDEPDPDLAGRWVAVLDEPAVPADWMRALRDMGWLHTAGRVLCPRHVAALEYLARAELDGLALPDRRGRAEHRAVNAAGGPAPHRCRAARAAHLLPICDSDFLGIFMDTFVTADAVITGLMLAETVGLTALHLHARQLLRRLRTDELTGLGNRAALIRGYGRLQSRSGLVGVLLLDLDGFKQVNDRHGHRTGDRLLRAVAARLTAACRPGEVAVRLHGDEFAVLLGPTGPARAAARRDALHRALAGAYRLDGLAVRASASVGVAVAPPGVGLGELLRAADQDMYAIKRVRHVEVGGLHRAGAA